MTIPAFKGSTLADPVNWEMYSEGIRFLAIRALGDRSAADDIVQEALLRAVKAFADPQRPAILDAAAFIHGIARHVIADAQRERFNRVELKLDDSIATEHPDALNALISAESRKNLKSELRKLSRDERELIDLAFVYSLKSNEIAERLGESPEAIRKRKSRLLDRLRAALSAD